MGKKANERSLPQRVELDAADVGVRLPRGLRLFDVRVSDNDVEWPRSRNGRTLYGSEAVEYVLRFASTCSTCFTDDLRGRELSDPRIADAISRFVKEARKSKAPIAIAICNFAVDLMCDSGRGDPWAKTDP